MTRAFTSFRRNSFSRWMLCVQDWKEMGETGGQQLSWPSMLPSPTLWDTPPGVGQWLLPGRQIPLQTKGLLLSKANTVSRVRPTYLRLGELFLAW